MSSSHRRSISVVDRPAWTSLAFAIVVTTVFGFAIDPVASFDRTETLAIKAVALDYIEGWYEGNAMRMEGALHTELRKRLIYTDPHSGQSTLLDMDALMLVERTHRGGGRGTQYTGSTSVTILDVFEATAVVRVAGPEWVDHLHLAKWNDEWKIVNVLWEPNPEHRERIAKSVAQRPLMVPQ